MSFIFGVLVGAVGVIIAAWLIWKNNKKKFTAAAIEILEGPGTAQEKVKKILDIIKS